MSLKLAVEPNDLEKLFVARSNNKDLEGLVALYEPHALLVNARGDHFVGKLEIREFLTQYLEETSELAPSVQFPALCSGDVAITSSTHRDGSISVEIARRQASGEWLWVVDQFAVNR